MVAVASLQLTLLCALAALGSTHELQDELQLLQVSAQPHHRSQPDRPGESTESTELTGVTEEKAGELRDVLEKVLGGQLKTTLDNKQAGTVQLTDVKEGEYREVLEKAAPAAKIAPAGSIIIVEWNLDLDHTKNAKYLFFKNRWWPWFSNAYAGHTVLLHMTGTNLRDNSIQTSSGMMGGTLTDLFTGDSIHANPAAAGVTPAFVLKEVHRCNNPGMSGDNLFLTNAPDKYDASGSFCTKMYNNTNITNSPHSVKFGGYNIVTLDSGKTTELASRMFRAGITGVMAAGHEKDVLLGSFNVDPSTPNLFSIYQGYPKDFVFKNDMVSHAGFANVVYPVDPTGAMLSPTCYHCAGKPSSETLTDYAITGPKIQLQAQPGFQDAVMLTTWKDVGKGLPLNPTTVASTNMFEGPKSTTGVHVPLVYSLLG